MHYPTFPRYPAHPRILSERYPRFSAAINTRCPVIGLLVMRPAMCSPFRREFRPPYLHLDAVPLPTVCAASDGGGAVGGALLAVAGVSGLAVGAAIIGAVALTIILRRF